ncbi:helix-turn-helix domain-containing protein [Streptomyces sp. NPDC057271]|uniref:helix-turn-helix domain-containing protein n=1 Tax=unclassified Streptomyces TaxID=2593676 RepID=UPI003641CBCD
MHQPGATFQVDGAAIRKKRMQAGIETEQLAEAVGITANYLNKLERGARRRLRPSKYVRLRAALNATDTDLLASNEAQRKD